MKVFISSEMNQSIDMERRQAARNEISEIGHVPYCFEDLPGRKNPEDRDTQEMCLALVRESDAVLAIIDDAVTDIMGSELREAMQCLDENRVFFYFTKRGKRDEKAKRLWDSVKKSWIIKVFETPDQLAKEISRSFASFAGDVLRGASKSSEIPLDETIKMTPGATKIWKLRLEKGKNATITCTATSTLDKFKAGLYPREEYFRRKPKSIFQGFNFGRQSEKPHHTQKVKVNETDDYYFVIRAGLLFFGPGEITVEIRVE
jgi:hypothetical protein